MYRVLGEFGIRPPIRALRPLCNVGGQCRRLTLGHGGDHVAALWNVVGQVGLGLGGVWLGFYLGL